MISCGLFLVEGFLMILAKNLESVCVETDPTL